MKTLTARSYQDERDLDAIANLINLCNTVDELEQGTSSNELRQSFTNPSFNPQQDTRIWEDETGQIIGYCNIYISEASNDPKDDADFNFYVRPTAQGGTLERDIFAWVEARAEEVRRERQKTINLVATARSDRAERIALLKRQGFQPWRYFFRMARSLAEPIPEPQFPQGFILRNPNPKIDAPAWVEMFNQTFIDHWNHHDLTLEQLNHELKNPNYNSQLDFVAISPENTFTAFCYCHINPEENTRSGRNEGWIGALGVRRGFRKQGLGRAMLLVGLHALKTAEVETAKLGVDADNPNGALQLYKSVGFHQLQTNIVYRKNLT
ncbi:GNAT family N-acetyltransferase [Lusitaniella coriacea]|uniref:GNAT family N-acetyltransferase n=1 Tax=Lusitaniella coriacea TaxID=1983105 RepID=UPI003CF0CA57